MLFTGDIQSIRRQPTGTIVKIVGTVVEAIQYIGGFPPAPLWCTKIRDASGTVPCYGFAVEPPCGEQIRCTGDVGGFVASAVSDPTFVAEFSVKRSWPPEAVEIVCVSWEFNDDMIAGPVIPLT